MTKKGSKKNKPTIAPGMDVREDLNKNASRKEIKKGEYTSVTHLSYDEVDPS
ncbi:hypothetical protein [Siminovitchia sp. 179-K 8D1 HS]|uniref:hypothetical protein n=1 Tax=Siminovitchia sp. 179-K 8D1 HS TaxID=3142385 RepID=UPI0039A21E91